MRKKASLRNNSIRERVIELEGQNEYNVDNLITLVAFEAAGAIVIFYCVDRP